MIDANKRRRLFLGCFLSILATSFGFAVRSAILNDWGTQFNLSGEQKGIIQGVGLYPFAISIIIFSLIVDRIGYGRCMALAFIGHVVSAILTIQATSFEMLYVATFIFALANGTVEAVINPVVATLYDKNKTHWLNVLHAGWPGGLVLGGLLAIAVAQGGAQLGTSLPGKLWQWQMGLILLPTLAYGLVLVGQRFPVQERVAAGVSYMDMLKEFGWGSGYIVFFLLVAGINQILGVAKVEQLHIGVQAAIAVIPTILFGLYVKSFGRPMFAFLMLLMFLLATTELGTDSWIASIMQRVLKNETQGTLFLVYTSLIMFVLRFFAGPIVHAVSPLGLLAISAAVAAAGLLWLSVAGAAAILFLAATLYGFGKTFFWPTTLGVVSEQYPRGGALMLNAISGVGMIAVGTLGNPGIGYMQDRAFTNVMRAEDPQLLAQVAKPSPPSVFSDIFGQTEALDESALQTLPDERQSVVNQVRMEASQGVLGKVAVLPMIMFVCYIILILYFRAKGGYRAQVLTGHAAKDEKFTGGVPGAMEG